MFKSIKSLFNKILHRKEKTEKVQRFTMTAKPVKPKKAEPKPKSWAASHPLHRYHFGTFRPFGRMAAMFKRTDVSASAVIHTKREHGLLPTRAEVRRRTGGHA